MYIPTHVMPTLIHVQCMYMCIPHLEPPGYRDSQQLAPITSRCSPLHWLLSLKVDQLRKWTFKFLASNTT